MKKSRLLLIALLLATLAACVTTPPPDPTLLNNARAAISQAEVIGAEEYSPLELRFARERLEAAVMAEDMGDIAQARRLADGAEIEAQLALARTQAALARAELAEKQRALDELRNDLIEAFGEEVVQ